MKKKLLASLLLMSTAILILTACGEYDEKDNKVGEVTFIYDAYDLVRDANTGCLYIIGAYDSVSPYYDENGEVAGCGEEDLDKTKYE